MNLNQLLTDADKQLQKIGYSLPARPIKLYNTDEWTRYDVQDLIKNYDLSVISPITTGNSIRGDLDKYKKLFADASITPQAIKHNQARAQEAQRIAQNESPGTSNHQLANEYARGYRQNARFLKKGAYLTSAKI